MYAPPLPQVGIDASGAAGAEYHRLLCRIQRNYQTVSQVLRIGSIGGGNGRSIELPFTRIADPDRVLDQVADAEDRRERRTGKRHDDTELHLPYWAELWDSAMGMAQRLVRENIIASVVLAPMRVLDLGCGMGLAGAVAAHLGAEVLLADLESPALLFAQLDTLRYAQRVRTRRLNWQTTRLDETFDLILGADIIYERAQWDHLEPFWRAHLAPGGRVLLGEPGRQTGDLFIDWIRARGWSLIQHQEPVIARRRPIRIYKIMPRAG